MEISRLTRDGTAETVSRDQILRRERGREIFIFPVQLITSRIGDLIRLIVLLLCVMTIHTFQNVTTIYRYEYKNVTTIPGSVRLFLFWRPYMATISVQFNGGCLPDIILLALSDDLITWKGFVLTLVETF